MSQLSPLPLLYLITDRRAFRRSPEAAAAEWHEQLAAIREAAQAGCQLIQIRERDWPARRLGEFVRAAVAEARPFGARVLVNDRLDVALASGADGVHLRVTSMPVAEVRNFVERRGPREFLIGASTHSVAEAQAAAGGADFIVCGPVYDTPSKQAYGRPLGLDRLAEVCQAVPVPVLAIGGIKMTNFREPLRRGAAGIAAISLFTDRAVLRGNIRSVLQVQSLEPGLNERPEAP